MRLLCFEVAGCEDMSPMEGIALERDGNTTTMQCMTGDEQTKAVCNGTVWVGSLPNCTTDEPEKAEDVPPGRYTNFRDGPNSRWHRHN